MEQQQGKRGFAAMDREKQREIASKGGRASHIKGTAHEFTADEARAAGRKGGEAVSGNRQHMSEIGRRGGEISGTRRAKHPRANQEGSGAPQPTIGQDATTPQAQRQQPQGTTQMDRQEQSSQGDRESTPPETRASDTQAETHEHEEAHSGQSSH